MPTWR